MRGRAWRLVRLGDLEGEERTGRTSLPPTCFQLYVGYHDMEGSEDCPESGGDDYQLQNAVIK